MLEKSRSLFNHPTPHYPRCPRPRCWRAPWPRSFSAVPSAVSPRYPGPGVVSDTRGFCSKVVLSNLVHELPSGVWNHLVYLLLGHVTECATLPDLLHPITPAGVNVG